MYHLAAEEMGSNLSDAHGVAGMLRMIWKQTKPLMTKENRANVMMMCFLTFICFFAAHGYYMW